MQRDVPLRSRRLNGVESSTNSPFPLWRRRLNGSSNYDSTASPDPLVRLFLVFWPRPGECAVYFTPSLGCPCLTHFYGMRHILPADISHHTAPLLQLYLLLHQADTKITGVLSKAYLIFILVWPYSHRDTWPEIGPFSRRTIDYLLS